MQLSDEIDFSDVQKCRALRSVLSQCEFPMKGDAVLKVASLLQWFNSLDVRLEKVANLNKLKSEPLKRKKLDGNE